MMKYSSLFALVVLLSLAPAVSASEPDNEAEPQHCVDPRPAVCTADYRLVCATLNDGSSREYSNGCTACGDDKVESWVEGKCSG
jgi:hypothetical protein